MAIRSLIAGAVVATIATLSGGAYAQGPCPGCGSQVPIKDIPKILAESATAMGLVRAQLLLIGQINNYEIVGSGTMVDLEKPALGQAVEIAKFNWNVHQQLWASRLDIEGPSMPRAIRVVKAKRAWDETWVEEKGPAGAVRKLKTAPADAVAQLRGQLVWLEPHAFFTQVAFAAGKKCLEAAIKACTTNYSIADEAGKTALNVEINGQNFKGLLDDKKRIGSIETTVTLPSGGGAKRLVAKYSGWRTGAADTTAAADIAAWGDAALDKTHNGVYWPEFITWELNGAKVLDIKMNGGWTNPYTVYPEPELLARGQ